MPTATSISKDGITWTFSTARDCGFFVTGDPWVVGPVTITQISPGTSQLANGRWVNGSMLDPVPTRRDVWNSQLTRNGIDSGLGKSYNTYYHSLNVAAQLPLTISAASSLVSSESILVEPLPSSGPAMKRICVLTVLLAAPPANAFRPPWAPWGKTYIRTTDEVSLTRFKNLAKLAWLPNPTDMLGPGFGYFNSILFDMSPNAANSEAPSLHAENCGENYGASIAGNTANAVIALNQDYTEAEKLPLLYKLVQRGIDIYGWRKFGCRYESNGGHNLGKKMFIVISGVALNDADMLAQADGNLQAFQDDGQFTRIIQQDIDNPGQPVSPSYPNGSGRLGLAYAQATLGMPEWMSNAVWNSQTTAYTSSERSKSQAIWFRNGQYYRHVTGPLYARTACALHMMGIQAEWNNQTFFDYVDQRLFPLERWRFKSANFPVQAGFTDPDTFQLWTTPGYGPGYRATSGNAPGWISGYPLVTTATGVVKIQAKADHIGWLYWVMRPAGTTAPSSTDVYNAAKAREVRSGALAFPWAGQDVWHTQSGLVDGTAYDLYLVAMAEDGVFQSAPTKVSLTVAGSVSSPVFPDSPPPVDTAPSIISQPTALAITEGANASLTVAAVGTAPLAFQWRKNGVAISGANTPSLSFAPAIVGDSGSYDCVVTNLVGSVTSNAAALTVSQYVPTTTTIVWPRRRKKAL